MTKFDREQEFEAALIHTLSEKGWEKEVLRNCSEEQLIRNWADILFENNRGIDRLNDYPLTPGEMRQIIDQITALRTPLRLSGFINGKSVTIKRDNKDDARHFGKEVSLKIYDRREIAAGQSRYQIAEQPVFPAKSTLQNDRRGDLTLLINGMPVIHIELKRSGVPVSQACRQIEKYAAEGVFTGLFSLVQIFVAMNPEETLYFANPGPDGKFNPSYYFHWADFNNEPVNAWRQVASTLLSIPMAHQLIGFYTVADGSDGTLKVMRSYQYFAANAISDKVSRAKREGGNQLGGYIWHTTGSGKTMTSFKSAQLIASSKDADKVVFLVDRIELGTQSLKEYRGFASESEHVAETEDTAVLVSRLKSGDPAHTLIVTSIQKMSRIWDDEGRLKEADLKAMNAKRIVFIVDECHRSTFGDMLCTIKSTFPHAMFFGFTGTPIQEENQKKENTTSTVFGDELHRYSIADGIRDKNVLGFDPYKVATFKDRDVRERVALEKARAASVGEALADPGKERVYYEYMRLSMAGRKDADGRYVKGIEDYLPDGQYNTDEHRSVVVRDIAENWVTLSHNFKFHAIFATQSIPEAIQYYRLLREKAPALKTTALFDVDAGIDNDGTGPLKEDGLLDIIADYNKRYGQQFTLPTFARMKKDIAARLAHKKPYERIEQQPEEEIDLLIVVNQMLTGFDSKWINALYLDKTLRYENIIQAFSRTNRLFGPEKPFGTIRYYRKPHTMERRIDAAVKLYSGDRPLGLFAEKLGCHLEKMNALFAEISALFADEGIENFSRNLDEPSACGKFVKLFNDFNKFLEAARIQGFRWNKRDYSLEMDGAEKTITVLIDEITYKTLVKRYQELAGGRGRDCGETEALYDLRGHLTEIDTGVIDDGYMNSRFDKYMKLLAQDGAGREALQAAEDELHKTFATLSQEEQKFANIFLHDIQRGDAVLEEGRTLRYYLDAYMAKAHDDRIHALADALGLDEDALRGMTAAGVTEADINEFSRFDQLKAAVDREKAKAYFEALEGRKLTDRKVSMKIDKLLRGFLLNGGKETGGLPARR